MNIIISNSSNKPIYEQITEQIKNKVVSNEFKTGELLPSIRTLAKDLRISSTFLFATYVPLPGTVSTNPSFSNSS